jgi:hypothetical protein
MTRKASHVILTAILLSASMVAGQVAAAPEYSGWSTPVNLGPVVNSPSADFGPAVSKDGLSLYFTSTRPGGFGGFDIWVSQRASVDDSWGLPINLGPTINTGSNESVPAFSRDGHLLFFNSDRPGGSGDSDLWVAWRADPHDDFGWEAPVNLGATVNSVFFDGGAAYFENEDRRTPLLFFNSIRPGGPGGNDVYVSEQAADGSFGAPTLVTELSSPSDDQRLSVRFDGLEVFFFSNRPGGLGSNDLWTSTRETVFDTWSTPVNLGGVVNSASDDRQPYIASDRETLYFSSNRPGGSGNFDLYMTTRTKVAPGQH